MTRRVFRNGLRWVAPKSDHRRQRHLDLRNIIERSHALESRVLLTTASDSYGQIALSFEANQGQATSDVQFLSRGQGYALALSAGEADLKLQKTSDSATHAVVTMNLVDGNPSAAVVGQDLLPGKINYFLGPDPAQWRTNIPTYAKVAYTDVYPGIDLVYYGNQRQLEYDFVVKPGSDPSRIGLEYGGANSMTLGAQGDLVLGTDGGQVTLKRPVLYQEIGGQRRDVSGEYALDGTNHVGFSVGSYDHAQPLVIDPILIYSTYFGGSGDDKGLAIAVDSKGGAYITGSTLSNDLAVTTGAVSPTSYVAELFKTTDAAATWRGSGSGLPDAHFSALVVDPTNANILYAATFNDTNFPARGIFKSTDGGNTWSSINNGLSGLDVTQLVMDPTNPTTLYCAANSFIFKTTDGGASWNLANAGIPSGSGIRGLAISKSDPSVLMVDAGTAFIYRTTNGGQSWTQAGPRFQTVLYGITIDPTDANTVYLAAGFGPLDRSPGGIFKSTNGGASWVQTVNDVSGNFTAGSVVVDPADHNTLYATVRQFSSWFLLLSTDAGVTWKPKRPTLDVNGEIEGIAVGGGGLIYLATNSQGVLKSTDGGGSFAPGNLAVGFVSQLAIDPSHPSTVYATTLGPPRNNQSGIATDAFVAKLTPDGRAYEYITYLGGMGNDEGRGIGVDSQGNAIVGGLTAAGEFPTTPGAFIETAGRPLGGGMGFVTKLNANGTGLIYSTYLGGSNSNYGFYRDEVHALVVDSQGRAVVTGQTSSTNFPTTPDAYEPNQFFEAGNAFVTQLSADGKGLVYSTYLGGEHDFDSGEAIALDSQGNIYVAGGIGNNQGGGAPGSNFPTTANAFSRSATTTPIGFFSKINPHIAGSGGLVYSTFLGRGGNTEFTAVHGLGVDATGRAYVVGNTNSAAFPMTSNAFQQTYKGDPGLGVSSTFGDAFVSVFDPSKSGAASLVYSTYLGGEQADAAYAVAIDSEGDAVVTGMTESPTFPSKDPLSPLRDGRQVFLVRLDISQSGESALVESTFLGGANDHAEGHGLAVDGKGLIYVTGFTSAADLQTLNPAQGAYHGGTDAFIAKISTADGLADLSVTTTATPAPVIQGNDITYTITVRNNGPDAVGGAYLSDMLDTGTTFISSSIAPSSHAGRLLTFAIGTLASGASLQFQLVVGVDTPSFVTGNGIGTTTNVATIVGDRKDPVPSNNTFAHEGIVTLRQAELALTFTTTPSPILVGQDLVYQITVTNSGPDDALHVVVTQNLPTNAIFRSATPAPTTNANNIATFSIGTIPSGDVVTIFVRMTPISDVGSFINSSVSLTATTLDDDSKNDSASLSTVIARPDQSDVGLTLDAPYFSVAFDGIVYTATIVNNGPHVADHVVFTSDVTALAKITSIMPSQGTASQFGNVLTAMLGTLGVGAKATVRYTVDAPASDASLTVHAAVTADETDPDPSNNSTKARTKVGAGSITFVVTNTNDSGPGSLRAALEDSNDQGSTPQVPNHVVFAIPESDPNKDLVTGAFVISPITEEPLILTATIVDGYSQAGSSPNTNPIDQADNAHIRIELDGSRCEKPSNGFTVFGSDSVFRGLAINRFITKLKPTATINLLLDGAGIFIQTTNVRVEGCFIGIDASGTAAHGNEVMGVALFGSSNTVGGTTPASRNVISGNGAFGVGIANTKAHNLILGNFLGTDVTGSKPLYTNVLNLDGIHAASFGVTPQGIQNTIGGTTPEARNVIAGNSGGGIFITIAQGSFPQESGGNNLIIGNYVGTDLTGSVAVPNLGSGLYEARGVSNTIGGSTAAERNIFSGNGLFGAELDDDGNLFSGNYVGTDATGTKPIGNGHGGILVGGRSNELGGDTPGAGNLISGNNGSGLIIHGGSNFVHGNVIGQGADGKPMGNHGDGFVVESLDPSTVPQNTRGNTVRNNIIAYNLLSGVAITAVTSNFGGGTGNEVTGNSIHDNGGLGIDLGSNHVTANHDPLVTSLGPNHLQNYPFLSSAVSANGVTTIQGTAAGLANRDYTINFYSSPYLDPTGFGEGATSLGSTVAHTDASGNASFSATITQALGGLYITSTATTPNPLLFAPGSDTSEFSLGILVTGPGPGPITPPTVSADLAITSQVLTTNPIVGGVLNYQFTVTNHGPTDALLAYFSHVLDTSFEFLSASSTLGSALLVDGAVTCNLGTLAPGDVRTITISVMPKVAGPVTVEAMISALSADPNSANDSTSLVATIGAGSLGTDLEIAMTADANPVPFGATLLYTVTITNKGPRVATGINFTDVLPSSVILLTDKSTPGFSGNGSTRSILVGALAPGDFIKVFLAVQPSGAGSIVNTASVTLNQDDPTPDNNSARLTTTVLKSPSISLLASSLATSRPGEVTTFTATVVSPTVGRPTGVVRFLEGSTVLATKPVDSSGMATFGTGLLPVGDHTIRAVYDGDANFAPSQATTDYTVAGEPILGADLSIQVVPSATSLLTGGNVTFTITLTNHGTLDATNVALTAALPVFGFSLVSAESTLGTPIDFGGLVIVVIDHLPANGSGTLTVVAAAGVHVGNFTVVANVTADQPDPNPNDNNVGTSLVVASASSPLADLQVAVSPSAAAVTQGQNVTFTVTVTNNGPSAASGVMLTDVFSPGFTFVSTSQGALTNDQIVVPLGAVASGATVSITIVATATSSGVATSQAHVVSSGPPDPSAANDSATAQVTVANPAAPRADLSVAVAASKQSVAQGQNVTFTVTVTNSGPNSASSVTVTDTLGTGLTLVSASHGTMNNGALVVPIGILPAGTTVTFTVIATATESGTLVNQAHVSSVSPVDLVSTNDTASAAVTSNAPITLTKTIDLVYGTISPAAVFAFPAVDAAALSTMVSAEIYNAILASAGLDARAITGLSAMRSSNVGRPSLASFFGTTTALPATVLGPIIIKSTEPMNAAAALQSAFQQYADMVTGESGHLDAAPSTTKVPLTFTFPNLTDASTGQLRNGSLTVNLIEQNASVLGPIATSLSLNSSINPAPPAAEVAFTAVVAGNGRVQPGGAGSVTFYDGQTVLGAAPVGADGKAIFATSALTSGAHILTAIYSGARDFRASASNPVDQLIGTLDGPRIRSLERFGFHRAHTTLVLGFDSALDQARAQDVTNYRIVGQGPDRKFGTRDDFVIPVASAVYDAATNQVTLSPRDRLNIHRPYRLIVNGVGPTGLSNALGGLLDGRAQGRPGSDYQTTITRADLVVPKKSHASNKPQTTSTIKPRLNPHAVDAALHHGVSGRRNKGR
jgi:uncharacterized repeat protein (TIGR01451 family)